MCFVKFFFKSTQKSVASTRLFFNLIYREKISGIKTGSKKYHGEKQKCKIKNKICTCSTKVCFFFFTVL
uniref:Uncharacterized protein n=1 Tax=Daphnia magna TaxID=35525 RepID=A0A0P5BK36_9CRUS